MLYIKKVQKVIQLNRVSEIEEIFLILLIEYQYESQLYYTVLHSVY